MYSLIEMLTYKRPVGTTTQREFCKRFIEPMFGAADAHGNYTLIIGDKPNICFTAHYDTVHKTAGRQKIVVTQDIASVDPISKDSNCLGADCTTGIWLILGMIEANIKGVYVIHQAEESGCKGSRALVKDYPMWLGDIDAVISFDRYGKDSIITHQSGARTCSNEFADSLTQALDMYNLFPDSGGSYTDSNEYASDVSECTNLSVGYMNQHCKNETQDLAHADFLLEKLIKADWSKLVFKRDPNIYEYVDYGWRSSYKLPYGYDDRYGGYYDKDWDNVQTLEWMLQEYALEMAEHLDSMGFTAEALCDELNLTESQVSRMSNSCYKYL